MFNRSLCTFVVRFALKGRMAVPYPRLYNWERRRLVTGGILRDDMFIIASSSASEFFDNFLTARLDF